MEKYAAKNFKYTKEGLGKVLGSLEQEIMEVLWKTPGLSGKGVFEEIRKSRDIAVTTVFTVLERLARKGLLRKAKGESVFIYEPVQTEDELARTVSKEVLKGVLDLWSGSAMASFVDIVASKDPGELDRLSRLISSKKHDLDKRPRK